MASDDSARQVIEHGSLLPLIGCSPGAAASVSCVRLLPRRRPGWVLAALHGEVVADVSTLDEPENAYERARFSRLVEVYAPVREVSDGANVLNYQGFVDIASALSCRDEL